MKARWTILLLLVLTVASAISVAATSGTSIVDTLKEGEVKGYTVDGMDVEVTNVFVSDPVPTGMGQLSYQPTTKLFVDGETSDALQTGQSQTLQDGLTLTITGIKASQVQGETTFTLSTEGTTSQPPDPETEPPTVQPPQGTGQDSPFLIVVAADASPEITAEAADVAATLQEKTMGGSMPIPVGLALTDENAYRFVSDDELASKLFIVMAQGHALLMDANSEDQYENWANDALANQGYTVAVTNSPKREYLLVKNMAATFFPDWTPAPEPPQTLPPQTSSGGSLFVGQTENLQLQGVDYEVGLVWGSGNGEAKFSINGVVSPTMGQGGAFSSGGLKVTLVSVGIYGNTGPIMAHYNYEMTGTTGQSAPPSPGETTSSDGAGGSTPPSPPGTACTADAKQCPDGSYVGRTGPDCAFAPCPGVTTGDQPPGYVGPPTTECNNGCAVDGKCLPYGTRVTNGEARYCSLDGMAQQQPDGSACQNSYECVSNQCYNAVCTSLEKQVQQSNSLLQKIVDWLKNIF